ncbi:hypothetical protein BHE74_00036672 [Ensete ventricosum]|nr:hypothetical protein BHE74_00036672 [Ensete ventricosum]
MVCVSLIAAVMGRPFLCQVRRIVAESTMPVSGQAISAATDREVLLRLKDYLEANNPIHQGAYARWNASDSSPCNWPGITCNDADRVTGVNLAESNITGGIFPNFHLLTGLTHLDLSSNTIGGPVPDDLNKCSALEHLSLSNNVISGELNLAGLTNLVVLDLTNNRFSGSIRSNFPAICANLVSLNISSNEFSGNVTGCFDQCPKLEYLDLSSNLFDGYIWHGFRNLRELAVADNYFDGELSSSTFASNCALEILDLSVNNFSGTFPGSIANCSKLTSLDLWGNAFTGEVPSGIGSLSELKSLRLGNNAFDPTIPEELLNCSKLVFLDFSNHDFGGDIPEIFGRFVTLVHLILYGNQYTGGIESSRVLRLPDLTSLNLSKNRFSGHLPVEITTMPKIEILILADNGFSGSIPPEVGGMAGLQLLDLSYNKLTGSIPLAIGNLTSLLWLTLADNDLTGDIPPEIGNCSSLMWLNLANNRLSGRIPPEISAIGRDPNPTFEANRREIRLFTPIYGDCLTMNRWLPASYPPFNFVYTLLTKRTCRTTWDRLLQGYAVFPICSNSLSLTRGISGYLQLSGNGFSGGIPPEIGRMRNFSMIQLDGNRLSGRLPQEIGELRLFILNVSSNRLSGEIPDEIGGLRCLSILDLSQNNFSGELPSSLNGLSELNTFNVSYNPLLSGMVPLTGQIATFDRDSFLGDPLINFISSSSGGASFGSPPPPPPRPARNSSGAGRGERWKSVLLGVFIALTLAFVGTVTRTAVRCWRRRELRARAEEEGLRRNWAW